MSLNKLLQSNNIIQLITYSIIGGTNLIINLIVINILSCITGIYSGFRLFIFDIVAFIIYSLNGYFLNKKFTFKSQNKSYLKYISVLGMSAFLNSILFCTLSSTNVFRISESICLNISKLTASITVGILTFLVNKFYVFNEKVKNS